MLKEDNDQRYHAANAPNIEATWWSWTLHNNLSWGVFIAKPPKPIMPKSEYLELLLPEVEELTKQAKSLLGPSFTPQVQTE